ncbi:hypothetical protein EGW08_000324, partial [Elysia chlorotica]
EFSSTFSAVDIAVSRRFENSLAGFTAPPPNPDGSFTVYQLDSCGDIFYQSFIPENSDPSDSEPFQNFEASGDDERAAAKSRVEQWLSALELQCYSASQSATDSTPVNRDGGLKVVDIDPKLMSDIFNCSSSEVSQLDERQAEHKEVRQVQPNRPHINLNSLKSLMHEKRQTQLLLALKDDKDITELLKKREERHLRLKLLKRRELNRSERQNNPKKVKRNKLYRDKKECEQVNQQTASSITPHSYSPESNLNKSNIQVSEQGNSLMDSSRTGEVSRRRQKVSRTNEKSRTEEVLNRIMEVANITDEMSSTTDNMLYRREELLSTTEEVAMTEDRLQFPLESSVSVVESKTMCFPEYQQNNNDEQSGLYTLIDQMNPVSSKDEPPVTLLSIPPSPRVGTPSLFSSSNVSSSSSLFSSSSSDEEEEETISPQQMLQDSDHKVHNTQTSHIQQEALPYSNVISWLLFSNTSKKEPSNSQGNEQAASSPANTSTSFINAESLSQTESKLNLLADNLRKAEDVEDDAESDRESVCSSQRGNTLARPDLRRVVDPNLSGFLSSPRPAKKYKRTIPE